MEPRIVDKGEIVLVGIVSHGGDVSDLWTRFETIEEKIPNAVDGTWYELHVYPADFTEGAASYLIAQEVTSLGPVPHAVFVKPLPAGPWAVFTHRCGAEGYDVLNQRVNDWLASAPYRYARNISLQVYDKRFRGFTDPDSQLDLLLPIEPKEESA